MEKKTFAAWDPYYDKLEKNAKYDLIGLINGKVEVKNVNKRNGKGKLLLFKVPLRLGVDGHYTQAIIEIWASTKKEEPVFTSDWHRLQVAYIRDLKFVDCRELHGLKYFQFVLPSNPNSRFIWLSGDRENYWMLPIARPENPRYYSTAHKFDGDSTSVRGFWERSNGSVFSKEYSNYYRDIHSTTEIGQTCFADWLKEVKMAKLQIRYRELTPEKPKPFFLPLTYTMAISMLVL